MTNDCCNHGAGPKLAATVPGLLERPLYTPGLILEDSDLTAAVDYTRELNRLLFSSLFGCGVVCGLEVSVDTDCDLQVTVAPGLALDGCGDPLQVSKPATIKLGRRDGVLPGKCNEPPRVTKFWVMLCGREKRCAPRATVCDADGFDAVREATRARALSEMSISFERPRCVCECAPLTPEERNDPDYNYDEFVDGLLPKADRLGDNADGNEGSEPEVDRCQVDHETRVTCAKGCGCGGTCSCGCCVLLAMVYWFEPENAWGVLHKGVRRFIRPKLLPDPIKDQRPNADCPPTERVDAPSAEPGTDASEDVAAEASTRAKSPARKRQTSTGSA